MPVAMTPELEKLVRSIYDSGDYESEGDVLEEALRLLQQRDRLRAEIDAGLKDLEEGRRIEGEELFRELHNRAAELASRKQ